MSSRKKIADKSTLAEAAASAAKDAARPNELEAAIGAQARRYRNELNMTVGELANLAGLSVSMVSKIENGMTSPSLATLKALAEALNVPVTALFRQYEEQRDATHVKADQGLIIERRGSRAGHQYQLLGHSIGKGVSVEPYLVTLTEATEVFPLFQHSGQEFIYLVQGQVTYRHGNRTYDLRPGDSLFFDANAPHGPEQIEELPIRMLSVIVQQKSGE